MAKFTVEKREIKEGKIKPNYSATPEPEKPKPRPYLLPKPKPKNDYERSWRL